MKRHVSRLIAAELFLQKWTGNRLSLVALLLYKTIYLLVPCTSSIPLSASMPIANCPVAPIPSYKRLQLEKKRKADKEAGIRAEEESIECVSLSDSDGISIVNVDADVDADVVDVVNAVDVDGDDDEAEVVVGGGDIDDINWHSAQTSAQTLRSSKSNVDGWLRTCSESPFAYGKGTNRMTASLKSGPSTGGSSGKKGSKDEMQWSKKDNETIQSHLSTHYDPVALSKELGRSKESVHKQVKRMLDKGLKAMSSD